MITITGLNDDIYTAMLGNAQERVIDSIMTAASQGRTSITIASKGLTPGFLSQLQNEGVDNLIEQDGRYKLFWEF
ncbi:hypothetical protein [Enterococcus casseliflavus]|uniref:hypothetical protein n=1 Tax=Enterococcus casseliflavus TaxID=37734 RepID=UPI0022E67018|nr:hypothetical protein [Enterococcus casseliflavus]